MPSITLNLTDADAALLARVQRRLGLGTANAAAEWLLKGQRIEAEEKRAA